MTVLKVHPQMPECGIRSRLISTYKSFPLVHGRSTYLD